MKNQRKRLHDVNQLYIITIISYMTLSFAVASVKNQLSELASLIITQCILVVPTVVFVIKNKIRIREFLRFKRIKLTNIIVLLFLTFALIPVLNLISSVTLLFTNSPINNMMSTMVKKENFILCLIAVAILPSIFEEGVYRGVFYNEYSKVNLRKGILLSAFMFAVLHMNINQFSYAFLMGIMFILIIEATDSIVAAMIVHFLINAQSLLLIKLRPVIVEWLADQAAKAGASFDKTLVLSNELTANAIKESLPQLILHALVGGLFSVLFIWLLARSNGRTEHIKSLFKRSNSSEQLVTKPLAFTLAFLTAVMVMIELIRI